MAYTPTLLILKTDLELKRSVIKDNVHFVPAFLEGMAIRNAWAELDQALDAVPRHLFYRIILICFIYHRQFPILNNL